MMPPTLVRILEGLARVMGRCLGRLLGDHLAAVLSEQVAAVITLAMFLLKRSRGYHVMIVMVAVTFLLGDRLFPFSSFPMYGDFPDRTYYVYLADGEGRPLPMFDLFGYRSTFVKRIYDNKVGDIVDDLEEAGRDPELHLLTTEQLRPAGDATLKWLVGNNRRRGKNSVTPPVLQLVRVDVTVRDGGLVRDSRVVGHFPGGTP